MIGSAHMKIIVYLSVIFLMETYQNSIRKKSQNKSECKIWFNKCYKNPSNNILFTKLIYLSKWEEFYVHVWTPFSFSHTHTLWSPNKVYGIYNLWMRIHNCIYATKKMANPFARSAGKRLHTEGQGTHVSLSFGYLKPWWWEYAMQC